MAEWLSEPWVAESAAAIELGGGLDAAQQVDAVVQVAVTGGPGGEARYHRRYAAGKVVGGGPGPAPNPDVALTLPAADARAVLEGHLDLSVAFMQGRLKTAGDNGVLLALLAGWSSPAGASCAARIRALTDSLAQGQAPGGGR